MLIAKTICDIRKIRKKMKGSVGFVPTMGYLHEGHLSLVTAAESSCDNVVTSIFINPFQFAPNEDLDKYPCDLERDFELLKKEKIDVLFAPDVSEMYPKDETTYVDAGEIGRLLCGKHRPTHFRGVTTIVTKLFNIVQPDMSFFGQKDYQQAIIIRKLVSDLNMPVKIIIVPTVREKDGLAMSSRNAYLTKQQRKAAICAYGTLVKAENAIKKGIIKTDRIISIAKKVIDKEPLCKLQYLEIVDTETLESLESVESSAVILVSAYVGNTRLIDNLLVSH